MNTRLSSLILIVLAVSGLSSGTSSQEVKSTNMSGNWRDPQSPSAKIKIQHQGNEWSYMSTGIFEDAGGLTGRSYSASGSGYANGNSLDLNYSGRWDGGSVTGHCTGTLQKVEQSADLIALKCIDSNSFKFSIVWVRE